MGDWYFSKSDRSLLKECNELKQEGYIFPTDNCTRDVVDLGVALKKRPPLDYDYDNFKEGDYKGGCSKTTNKILKVSPTYVIDNFDIEKELGSGRYGRVFKVVSKVDSKPRALKMIKDSDNMSLISDDVEFDEQLNDLSEELKVLSQLKDKHIVKYCSAFASPESNAIGILMEYIPGKELGDYARQLTPNDRISMFWGLWKQALVGLNYMHRKGITHRDIKYENIMVTSSGNLVFIDFGLSCEMNLKECSELNFDNYPPAGPIVMTSARYSLPISLSIYFSSDIWGTALAFLCFLNPGSVWKYYELTNQLADLMSNTYERHRFFEVKYGDIEKMVFANFSTNEINPNDHTEIYNALTYAMELTHSGTSANAEWRKVERELLNNAQLQYW